MAFGNKRGGLDLSGVGHKKFNLPGGDMKTRSDLQMAPSSGGRRRRGGAPRGGNYVRHTAANGGKQRKHISRGTLTLVIALVIVSLLIATGVGVIVYQVTIRNALKMDLDQTALTAALSQDDSDVTADHWSLLVRTDASSSEAGHGKLADIALVRVNAEDKNVSFLWVPVDTRVYMAGYGYRTIQETFDINGDSSDTEGYINVIGAVEKLANVKISHYSEVNSAGLERLESTLSPLGIDTAAADTSKLTGAICKKLFGSSSESISSVAAAYTSCVSTDLSTDEVSSVLRKLQGTEASDTYQCDAPTTIETEGGITYSALDSDSWKRIVARVSNGMSPTVTKKETARYKSMRSSATVSIWNGVGVSGVAADCSSELEKLGWKVGDTGNAGQFVYKETLIVYRDTADKELAELLASDLGQGRVVRSGARYSYEGTLLIAIGKDYQPY